MFSHSTASRRFLAGPRAGFADFCATDTVFAGIARVRRSSGKLRVSAGPRQYGKPFLQIQKIRLQRIFRSPAAGGQQSDGLVFGPQNPRRFFMDTPRRSAHADPRSERLRQEHLAQYRYRRQPAGLRQRRDRARLQTRFRRKYLGGQGRYGLRQLPVSYRMHVPLRQHCWKKRSFPVSMPAMSMLESLAASRRTSDWRC